MRGLGGGYRNRKGPESSCHMSQAVTGCHIPVESDQIPLKRVVGVVRKSCHKIRSSHTRRHRIRAVTSHVGSLYVGFKITSLTKSPKIFNLFYFHVGL